MKLLITLELEKFSLKKYLAAAAFIALGICLFTTVALYATEQDSSAGYTDAIMMVNAAAIESFLVYGALLTVKIITDEYTKRTILTLFTYSVKRTHFIYAKLFVIITAALIMAVFTELICLGYMYLFGAAADLALGAFSSADFRYWLIQLAWGAALLIVFSLLQISVAIIKKSGQYVYISALISILLVQIIISQELEQYTAPAAICFVCLLITAVKKYMGAGGIAIFSPPQFKRGKRIPAPEMLLLIFQ